MLLWEVLFYFNENDPDLLGNGLDLDYTNYAPGADNTQNTRLDV